MVKLNQNPIIISQIENVSKINNLPHCVFAFSRGKLKLLLDSPVMGNITGIGTITRLVSSPNPENPNLLLSRNTSYP